MTQTWILRADLAQALHCSDRQIQALCEQGVFVAGQHWYFSGLSGGGKHVFCLEACRQALLDHTAALDKARRDEAAVTAKAVTYDEEHLDQLLEEVKANG